MSHYVTSISIFEHKLYHSGIISSSSPDFHDQLFYRLFYLLEALLNSRPLSVLNSEDSSSSIVTKHKYCLVIITRNMRHMSVFLEV